MAAAQELQSGEYTVQKLLRAGITQNPELASGLIEWAKENNIDEDAFVRLRCLTVEFQLKIMKRGSVADMPNPNDTLVARIRDTVNHPILGCPRLHKKNRSHEMTALELQQVAMQKKEDQKRRQKLKQEQILLEQMARVQMELDIGNLNAGNKIEVAEDPETGAVDANGNVRAPRKQYDGIEVMGESLWDQQAALGQQVDYQAGRLNKDGTIGGKNALGNGGGGKMALENGGKGGKYGGSKNGSKHTTPHQGALKGGTPHMGPLAIQDGGMMGGMNMSMKGHGLAPPAGGFQDGSHFGQQQPPPQQQWGQPPPQQQWGQPPAQQQWGQPAPQQQWGAQFGKVDPFAGKDKNGFGMKNGGGFKGGKQPLSPGGRPRGPGSTEYKHGMVPYGGGAPIANSPRGIGGVFPPAQNNNPAVNALMGGGQQAGAPAAGAAAGGGGVLQGDMERGQYSGGMWD